MIWVKLEITGHRPLFIGAYYRPSEDDLESLQELQNSISQVRSHSDNVWVLGDFNLPKLIWPESLPEFKPECSTNPVYDIFLNTLNDYNFTQVVTEPTRIDNILDLFLTTNPTLITDVKCSPGLGDHDLISAEALLKPTLQKQKPRKTMIFRKADWPKLKSKMKAYQQTFLTNHIGKTAEELWTDFTTTLDKFSHECIPSKLIQGKSSLPWVTQEIKRLIRKRDSLYTNFKKTGRLDIKTQFQTLRQQIKKKIKASYQAYLENLLGLTNEEDQCDSKKLFSFLKNSRRDQQGTPPLKHENKLHTDTKIKADLFNQQFNCLYPQRTFVSQTPGQNASAGPEISGWPAS